MAGVELWLIRHGDAEAGDGDDAARRLTPKGEAQAAAAAGALVALDRGFLAIHASPRVRARDTARPIAEALGLELRIHEPLSGDFGAGDVAALILGLDRGGRVILVGHEPDLSALVEHTTGAQIAMKKGGIAVVRLDDEAANELVALLRPGELRLMAGRVAA
jgi:phosphohistidine phosphatase